MVFLKIKRQQQYENISQPLILKNSIDNDSYKKSKNRFQSSKQLIIDDVKQF